MASSSSCACGVAAAAAPAPATAAPSSSAAAQQVQRAAPAATAAANGRCKACRVKSRFGFLRGQRSLDLGAGGAKEAEAAAAAAGPARVTVGRRARSAERYDGLRVNDRGAAGAAARPVQVASITSAPVDRPASYAYPDMPPISSPPPTYEVAVGKGQLPSYEESQSRRMQQLAAALSPVRSSTPPPPWSHSAASTSQLPAAAAAHPKPASACTCAKCKVAARSGLRVNLPSQVEKRERPAMAEAQRQLRVALPPESAQQQQQMIMTTSSSSSTHEHCPCRKCQTRYGNYPDSSGDVLLSLDTATAMQGVLTDGIALCDVM